MKRKGYGLGKGQGYKNLMPMDSYIHSLSAKGVKTTYDVEVYNRLQAVYPDVFRQKKFKNKKSAIDYAKAVYEEENPVESARVMEFKSGKGKIIWDDGEKLSAKGNSDKAERLVRLKELMGADLVEDLQKQIQKIESGIPTTKDNYGKYMVILEKFPRNQWREITAILLFLGAKRKGVISAVQVLGYDTINAKGKKKKKLTKEQKIRRGIGFVAGLVAGAEATKGTRYEGAGALVGGYAGYKIAEGFDAKGWKKTMNSKEIVQWDEVNSNIEIAVTNFGIDKDYTIILKKSGRDIKNLATGLTKKQAMKKAQEIMKSDDRKQVWLDNPASYRLSPEEWHEIGNNQKVKKK